MSRRPDADALPVGAVREIPAKWRVLPPPITPEQMRTVQPNHDAPDPDGGRNPDTDFLIRYGLVF